MPLPEGEEPPRMTAGKVAAIIAAVVLSLLLLAAGVCFVMVMGYS